MSHRIRLSPLGFFLGVGGLSWSKNRRTTSFLAGYLLALLLCPHLALSQHRVELSGYGGYQFWGGLTAAEGEVGINDAPNWGGSLSYYVEPNIRFEVSYFNQSTTITFNRKETGITETLFDATIHYVQAGAIYESSSGDRFAPYGGLTAGVVGFDPAKAGVSSEWRLAFGLNGGVKIYLSENIGFRGQGSLLIPIQWGRGGIFCGREGCSIEVSKGTAILQGVLTGGLFVDL